MKHKRNTGFQTRAIHEGEEPRLNEYNSGDVVSPIHLSTTFARRYIEKPTGGFEYTRSGNPTRQALEKKYASLENAVYGLSFGSGLGAENAILMSLLHHGDHMIASNDLYGGTIRAVKSISASFDIKCSYVDLTNVNNIGGYINSKTKLVWIESPTNPLLNIIDIKGTANICKKHNIILVVDNTFLTPYFQKPLDLGADIVVHSATKYMGGHSDVLGGAVMTNDHGLYKKIKFNQNAIGAVPSPFDCYLTMRGMKTLALRMEQHQKNALSIANWLSNQKNVKKVIYPGLKNHPQHELIKKQARGYGGMISFEIIGELKDAREFLSKLEIISLAESLGGVESLIEHPGLMTHSSLSSEQRQKIGISDTLIRFSVGIEDKQDLINDLAQAMS